MDQAKEEGKVQGACGAWECVVVRWMGSGAWGPPHPSSHKVQDGEGLKQPATGTPEQSPQEVVVCMEGGTNTQTTAPNPQPFCEKTMCWPPAVALAEKRCGVWLGGSRSNHSWKAPNAFAPFPTSCVSGGSTYGRALFSSLAHSPDSNVLFRALFLCVPHAARPPTPPPARPHGKLPLSCPYGPGGGVASPTKIAKSVGSPPIDWTFIHRWFFLFSLPRPHRPPLPSFFTGPATARATPPPPTRAPWRPSGPLCGVGGAAAMPWSLHMARPSLLLLQLAASTKNI